MVYPEYESCKAKVTELQEQFDKLVTEKERIFAKALPNAVRYDKENVQTSTNVNVQEEYVIALDEKQIDEKLEQARALLKDRTELLEMKKKKLFESQDLHDKVYRMRYVERFGIKKIARILYYSRTHIYRILDEIENDVTKCYTDGTK